MYLSLEADATASPIVIQVTPELRNFSAAKSLSLGADATASSIVITPSFRPSLSSKIFLKLCLILSEK